MNSFVLVNVKFEKKRLWKKNKKSEKAYVRSIDLGKKIMTLFLQKNACLHHKKLIFVLFSTTKCARESSPNW